MLMSMLVLGFYEFSVRNHSSTPVLSSANALGHGKPPEGCSSFNPSYISASSSFNQSGVLLRMCCGDTCVGHGRRLGGGSFPKGSAERIGFAPCDLESGVCGDADASFDFDPAADTEDPRAFHYDGFYYNFYYSKSTAAAPGPPCSGAQCTVRLAKTRTPLAASSWQPLVQLPWHRNGCCAMRPRGQRSYCIWGEGPSPFAGLGISYTTDIDSGVFVQVDWSVAAGVDSPLSTDGRWLLPLAKPSQNEVKLEAGTHLQRLSSGDLVHFYAAATPGWVPDGNYTAGYLVLSGSDPTHIVQRSDRHVLVPTYEYETLCGGEAGCKYRGERKNVIFLCSATPMAAVDTFRLFFGGGDGNVGTAVVQVRTDRRWRDERAAPTPKVVLRGTALQ